MPGAWLPRGLGICETNWIMYDDKVDKSCFVSVPMLTSSLTGSLTKCERLSSAYLTVIVQIDRSVILCLSIKPLHIYIFLPQLMLQCLILNVEWSTVCTVSRRTFHLTPQSHVFWAEIETLWSFFPIGLNVNIPQLGWYFLISPA